MALAAFFAGATFGLAAFFGFGVRGFLMAADFLIDFCFDAFGLDGATFLAAGFLALTAAGFFAAGFFAAGFLATFFALGFFALAAFGFFAAFGFAGLAALADSLNDPLAPLPLVCTKLPPAVAFFKYFLMNGANLSASTLLFEAMYFLIACNDEPPRSCRFLMALLTNCDVGGCDGLAFLAFGAFGLAATLTGSPMLTFTLFLFNLLELIKINTFREYKHCQLTGRYINRDRSLRNARRAKTSTLNESSNEC